MSHAADQLALMVPQEPTDSPTRDSVALMFERLAANKDVDVDKLQRLIEMQERIMRHNAVSAFNAAFSLMQADIPEIDEHGAIKNREGGIQSRYAKNEDIQKVLRPILRKHGFSLSFRTEWPSKTSVKVVGILTHSDGHVRESEFLSDADTSGSKNSVQALGSAISYGHRYTTTDLLNITSRERIDDDGAATSKAGQPDVPVPDGFDAWYAALESVADDGLTKLTEGWNKSKPEFRNYLMKTNKSAWNNLKIKAAKVVAK